MSILDTLVNGLENFGGLFFEETEVARYLTVPGSDPGFTIPNPTSPESDVHIQQIHAPGLVTGGPPPVLFFRTTHGGSPRLSIRLNVATVFNLVLPAGGTHSWHEILPDGALRPQANELVLSVAGEGEREAADVGL